MPLALVCSEITPLRPRYRPLGRSAIAALSLNGVWDVQDSVDADAMQREYNHKAPVPGLVHSAAPPFLDVDQYQSRELLTNLVRQGRIPEEDLDNRRCTRRLASKAELFLVSESIRHAGKDGCGDS